MNRLEYKEFQGGETIPYDIMADVCVCVTHPTNCSPPSSSVHGFPRQEY